MRAALPSLDDEFLAGLGEQAVRLVCAGNLHSLHTQFGYALAFDREPIEALKEDVAAVLAEIEAQCFGDQSQLSVEVSHFKPNDTGLRSLVECLLPANNGRLILVELVVSTSGSESFLTLEQISAVT